MLGIGIPADGFHIATDARCWRVARLIFTRGTVNLLQLGIVDVRSESILYRFKINLVAVRGDLHPAINPAGTILHELFRPFAVASANQVTHTQLGVSVDTCPRPDVSPSR